MSRPVVLVVEDDDASRLALCRGLEVEGYEVRGAARGAEALAALNRTPPDVIVLDLGLPDLSGLDVIRVVRGSSDTPILVLTGHDSIDERVSGLDEGADDYLVKPAALREVAARVRALLRRRGRPPTIEIDDVLIDVVARGVWRGGEAVSLTVLEFDLLVHLARHRGRAVSRDELLVEVWHSSPEYQKGAVITEYVRRLRLKLGELPITSVRGIGYRLDAP